MLKKLCLQTRDCDLFATNCSERLECRYFTIRTINRRIRLTCLYLCCHSIQTTWRFIWEVIIVQFVTHNWLHWTSHVKHHMTWNEWQKECLHISRSVYYTYVSSSLKRPHSLDKNYFPSSISLVIIEWKFFSRS